ncbi:MULTISPECIES: MATE family efflux transporter [Parabacteroides]|jgi:MATE efflux family protein|uniref:Multidrug-efflux transporter n=1 Tax=Parabacteroides faecis TaxID=1217282 RepID=A0ABR6KQZ1_9BACT|nr:MULTISPECIES: MATE family efflux transporter [Parabacteroides]MBB4623926.1 putative MATE family efflux protein [Parabacteroides faecis]MCS2894049.1 MATE family efflux transporter [Parabacteroides faecis]RHR39610.1 MATE family efflux transporter [Parabacteroides sp. AF18-52]UVQ47363.1 MATE family efflux transporter [Parabacteroides faecis]GGK07811.1 MATE family efflux transporter [Parabacteroides faecis]
MQFTNKQIWQITYPVLISLLMEHMIGLTDTAYLGRVGEVELGASALAGVYYLVIYMLGFGFSVGAQVLIARRNGAHDYTRIGPVFMQGTLFLLLLAAVLFTASHLYSPLILRKLIGSDDVYRATMSYVDWRVYGFFFSFIAVMFRAFYVGITKTKILTANSVVMVLTNVVLNYILIFGKFGFPALGIAGAAIASSISEAVSVLFFIIYTWKKIDYKKYAMFSFVGIDFRMLKQILNVSVWIMVQHGIAFVGWFIFFVVMEHQGERPLAVTNVVRSISSFLFMFVNAFASTSSSLVSNLIGSGKSDQVLGLCGRMIRLCYFFVLPLAILIALFPDLVLRIYTDNPDLIQSSTPSLWVMLSSYILAVPAFIYFFSVSGTGNTQSALMIDMASIFVYVAYTFLVGIWLHADVAVCWTTEHVYNGMLLISFFYLWKGNWRNKRL